jgi:hypothetical protein
VDNSGYELAAAGAELLLDVELELEPFELSDELELDELEDDESEDEDVEAPADSLLFDPLVELLLVLFADSRLSLR